MSSLAPLPSNRLTYPSLNRLTEQPDLPGYLIIDHTAGTGIGPDPKSVLRKGEKWEYKTEGCVHCQAVIAIYRRSVSSEYHLSNINFGLATPQVHTLNGGTTDRPYCRRCDALICRRCAAEMERLGDCPGPFKQKLELALAGKGIRNHQYGQSVAVA